MPGSNASSNSSQSYANISEFSHSTGSGSTTTTNSLALEQQNAATLIKNRLFLLFGHLGNRVSWRTVSVLFAGMEFLQMFGFSFDSTGYFPTSLQSEFHLAIPFAGLRTWGAGVSGIGSHEAVLWIAFIYMLTICALLAWKLVRLHRGEEGWDRVSTVARLMLLPLAPVLYVPFFSNIVALLACRHTMSSSPDSLAYFSDTLCYGTSGILNVIIGSITAIALVVVSGLSHALLFPIFYDNNEFFSMTTCRFRAGLFAAKTLLVAGWTVLPVAAVPVAYRPVLMAFVVLVFLLMLGSFLYTLPYHRLPVNYAIAACLSVCAMSALVQLSIGMTGLGGIIALVVWLALLVVAGVGGFLGCRLLVARSALRLRRNDARENVEEYAFGRESDVEFATRFAYGRKEETVLEQALAIYAHGAETFPASVSVRVAQCVFMCSHLEEHQLLQVNINRCKRLPLPWDLAFVLFRVDIRRRSMVREQDGGMEEISVKLQRAAKYQDECKRYIRAFWRHLSKEEDLNALPEIVSSIDKNEKLANDLYAQMLMQFPKSARVLRAYGAFLEEIKNDIELAEMAFRSADMLEEERVQQQHKRNARKNAALKKKGMRQDGSVEKLKQSKSALKKSGGDNAAAAGVGDRLDAQESTDGKRTRFSTMQMTAPNKGKSAYSEDEMGDEHYADMAHSDTLDPGAHSDADDLEHIIDAKAEAGGRARGRQRRIELVRQARFRKRIESSRSSALEKMVLAKRVTALIFIIDLVTIFVATRVIVDQFTDANMNLVRSGWLTTFMHSQAMNARGMHRAAVDNNATKFSEQRNLLLMATNQYEQTLQQLRPSVTGNLTIVWQDKTGQNKTDFTPPYISGNVSFTKKTSPIGLWDLTTSLKDSGFIIADTPMSTMTNADTHVPFRYLMDNFSPVISGIVRVRAVYQSRAASVIATLLLTLEIITPISLAVLIVVAVAGIRPAIARLIKERTDALKLFTAIPKQTVAQIYDKVSGQSDDSIKDHEEELQDEIAAVTAEADVEVSASSGLPIVRGIRARFTTVTVVACVIIIAMFAIGMIFTKGSGITGAQINICYGQRSMVKRIHLFARELLFTDQYTWAGNARTTLISNLNSGITTMTTYHNQFKYGDPTIDIPPALGNTNLEYLLFDKQCHLRNPNIKCSGISTLMNQLLATTTQLIALPAFYYTDNNTNMLDLDFLAGDGVGDVEVTDGPGELDRLLIQSANVLRDQQQSFVTAIQTSQLVIFVLSFPLIVIGWFYLKPYEARIQEENSRTMKMLLMIPVNVIDSVPAIREYLDTGRQENAQMRLKDAYEEAVARTQSILNACVDGIVVVNTDRVIESCNPAAERIFGWDESELKGKSSAILMPDHLSHALAELMEHYLTTGEATLIGQVRELKGVRKDGTVFPTKLAMSASTINNKVLFAAFIRDITETKENERLLTREKEKSEKLLQSLLPNSIADQLKEEGIDGSKHLIAEGYKEVTVLFADIVKFTNISSVVSPSELVFMLNQLFSMWDLLAQKHKLEKIKTIGDSYMVAGGLPERSLDHAQRMMEFAIDMLESLKDYNGVHGRDIQVRIGINCGPVVAGVIGRTKICYDLWGDAVNVASRMESSGVPGRIQVSHKAFENLNSSYLFEERGKMDIKGKGAMLTYLYKDRRFVRTDSGRVIRRATLTPPPGAAGFFTSLPVVAPTDTSDDDFTMAEKVPEPSSRRASVQIAKPTAPTAASAAPAPEVATRSTASLNVGHLERSDSELIRDLSNHGDGQFK
eukprot:TRINITY_DN4101_c0_g1_i5.p1 TRINITY_DN4101_c0_g1~~TRINITY_DN4101_c0_g1_i5.p1  ORF type:complete len:1760 (+),score=718.95 TRINITY_DN4101_c0_g1_i5:237-5516(+)